MAAACHHHFLASRGRFFASAALAALALAVHPGPLAAQDEGSSLDDRPHITVVGSAAATVVPDTAEIALGVTATRPSAAEAWNAVARVTQDVVDAAKGAGVKPQGIGTAAIDLYQEMDDKRQPDGTVTRQSRGFRASTTLRVRTSQLDAIGALTQALVNKGANTFDGITFSLAHPEAVMDHLRAEAMRDARHQADILAVAAGVKLGALLQVERPDRPAPVHAVMRNAAAGPATMPVEPGTQTLSAEVEATYAIE